MASENNEISDIVKKCKILLLDIEGTTTSISFVKDKLFPYAEANVQQFLESQWEKNEVKEAVAGLRKLAIEDQDKNVEGVVTIPGEDAGKDEQITGLVSSVKWLMSADRKVGPLKQLQGLIWSQGYENGDIKGHVYDDVSPALEQWRSSEGQKVYIYSSGSVQAQKLLFKGSVAGDLLPHIEGHFDTAIGAKQEAASYAAIAEKIGSKPEEILFLTDIVKEAEAARASGLHAALVSREGNTPLSEEATSSYPVLQSFDQLAVSNKRKPEPQEEVVPAKVPKTDIEANVKTAAEMEATDSTPAAETMASTETAPVSENGATVSVAEEAEKMEVEAPTETAPVVKTVANAAEKTDEPVRIETTIEEVSNSNEAADAPVCDIEPVIEESIEKTEKNETEMMETESTETVETASEPKEMAPSKVVEETAPVAAEMPPSGVTVEDVTNDQQNVPEGTEIVDDLVPVVEEPATVEMEDLKNVGDVLDKECDEILSKVQDVTNLDSIPVKSMLNSTTVDAIEAENGENTNDIVDSILDSEMELGVKPEDIDVNAVQEITDAKIDVAEKPREVSENVQEKNNVEERSAENGVESVEENITQDNEAKEQPVASTEEKLEEMTSAVSKEESAEKIAPASTIKGNSEEISPETSTEKKLEEVSSVENVAEKVKKDNVVTDKFETTEVTDVDTKESKPVSVDEAMETESVVESKSDIVSEIESKEVAAEVVSLTTPVETVCSKEMSGNHVETDGNKMETEETATSDVVAEEKKETIAGPVENAAVTTIEETIENKVENKVATEVLDSAENVKTKETKESVDTEMETVEIAQPEESLKTKESIADSVEKVESEAITEPAVDNKIKSEDNTLKSDNSSKPEENNMESESAPQDSKGDIGAPDTPVSVTESKVVDNNETEKAAESTESVSNDVEMETATAEKQVNGKTNGDAEVNLNGDASKDEELNARLSENGENKKVNGANGNGESNEVEMGQGDKKVETEISDIKVKTVAPEEPRTDPIEQPVEA